MIGIKKILSLLFLVFLAACSGRPGGSDGLFVPHTPSLTKLSNGTEVMVLEDHEFPTLQMQVYVRGGAVFDPPGQEGLAGLAMQSIRLGGAQGREPGKIEEDLEFVGASLEMSASAEFLSAGLSLMAKDADLGLDILFDLLRRPSLDATRFAVVKSRMKDAIQRDEEDPLQLASREFPKFVYGPDAAWGRRASVETLDKISREDVVAFCQKYLHPDRLLIAVSGDISEKDIVDKIRKRLDGWEAAKEPLPSIAPVSAAFEKSYKVLARKGLTQATVVMGHLSTRRDNPDKYALLVMNFILGGSGSLTSRMGEEIRSNAGKAYGVWSDFGFGKDLGLFRGVAQTALDNTGWVVKKMTAMIGQMATEPGVSPQELENAKKAILHSLVFDFETRFAQVKEQARFRLWDYPEDYIVRFQKGIAAVTREDVERVAKAYLHPEGLKTLIVTDEGQAESLKKELGINP